MGFEQYQRAYLEKKIFLIYHQNGNLKRFVLFESTEHMIWLLEQQLQAWEISVFTALAMKPG